MYCNTNREVTTCSCWTTAHFEKVVKRVKECFQVFYFLVKQQILENTVALFSSGFSAYNSRKPQNVHDCKANVTQTIPF